VVVEEEEEVGLERDSRDVALLDCLSGRRSPPLFIAFPYLYARCWS
jgi:hypothetical protein